MPCCLELHFSLSPGSDEPSVGKTSATLHMTLTLRLCYCYNMTCKTPGEADSSKHEPLVIGFNIEAASSCMQFETCSPALMQMQEANWTVHLWHAHLTKTCQWFCLEQLLKRGKPRFAPLRHIPTPCSPCDPTIHVLCLALCLAAACVVHRTRLPVTYQTLNPDV